MLFSIIIAEAFVNYFPLERIKQNLKSGKSNKGWEKRI